MIGCNSTGREPEYAEHVARLRPEYPDLADEVHAFTGITPVLEWMQRRSLPEGSVDIVGQDEFHYDFLIRIGPGERWIVFGVT